MFAEPPRLLRNLQAVHTDDTYKFAVYDCEEGVLFMCRTSEQRWLTTEKCLRSCATMDQEWSSPALPVMTRLAQFSPALLAAPGIRCPTLPSQQAPSALPVIVLYYRAAILKVPSLLVVVKKSLTWQQNSNVGTQEKFAPCSGEACLQ